MNPIQAQQNINRPRQDFLNATPYGLAKAREQRLSEKGVVMSDLSDSPTSVFDVATPRQFSVPSLSDVGDVKRILKNGEAKANPRQEISARKLSEKYIAGFMDADGSIQVMWRPIDRKDSNPELRRGYLSLEFSQVIEQDKTLSLIQQCLGGKMYYYNWPGTDRWRSTLKIQGKGSIMALERMKKHLVLKRHYAEAVLSVLRRPVNREETQSWLSEQRKMLSRPLPNFPSRKWLAGYFDGDGSLQVRLATNGISAQPVAAITAHSQDCEGIKIIHKNFGGSLRSYKDRPHLKYWLMTMPPSKAKQFLGYFAKHLIIKKDQAYFILGCAKMGNFRDGKTIQATMKKLKSQPHRLNESEVDVSGELANVKTIEIRRERFKRKFNENCGCLQCGSLKYYSDGICRVCYDRNRFKRQSVQA